MGRREREPILKNYLRRCHRCLKLYKTIHRKSKICDKCKLPSHPCDADVRVKVTTATHTGFIEIASSQEGSHQK